MWPVQKGPQLRTCADTLVGLNDFLESLISENEQRRGDGELLQPLHQLPPQQHQWQWKSESGGR